MRSTKPIPVWSLYDPALDDTDNSEGCAERVAEYTQTLDISLLKAKPGQKPTTYYLGRIRSRLAQWVDEGSTAVEQWRRAFAASVVRVENARVEDDSPLGVHVVSALEPEAAEPGKPAPWSNEEMEGFPWADVRSIGHYAYQRIFLVPGNELRLRPLHSAARDWGTRVSLAVAAKARCRSQSSGKSDDTVNSGDSGEKDTGATATGAAT